MSNMLYVTEPDVRRLEVYLVRQFFPKHLRADFFWYGDFQQRWQHDSLFPHVELSEYVIAINDRCTPRQKKSFGGADVLIAHRSIPGRWDVLKADHRERFSSLEQQQERLSGWIQHDLVSLVNAGMTDATVLYQGRNYEQLLRIVSASFPQDYDVQRTEVRVPSLTTS